MAINIGAMEKMTPQQALQYMHLLLVGQLDSEEDPLANLSNTSALLYAAMRDLNWAGFYLLRGKELVLGPFQGLPACNRIQVGRGVCGTAVATRQSIRVPDVHKFPGHIACDSASQSELVVPILDGQGKIKGVIDLDSPQKNRFSSVEQEAVKKVAQLLGAKIPWE